MKKKRAGTAYLKNTLLLLFRMDVPVGKTVYTCMLNKNAGVEADLTVSIQGTEEVCLVQFTLLLSHHLFS